MFNDGRNALRPLWYHPVTRTSTDVLIPKALFEMRSNWVFLLSIVHFHHAVLVFVGGYVIHTSYTKLCARFCN